VSRPSKFKITHPVLLQPDQFEVGTVVEDKFIPIFPHVVREIYGSKISQYEHFVRYLDVKLGFNSNDHLVLEFALSSDFLNEFEEGRAAER